MTDSLFIRSHSATGMIHAMSLHGRDATGLAECGSAQTMPARDANELPGQDAYTFAVALNDTHLDGVRMVCRSCRTRMSVLALA